MHEHLLSNLTTHVSLIVDDKFNRLRQQIDEAKGKIHELKRKNQCVQNDLLLHVNQNKEELCQLREDGLKTQSLYAEMCQQYDELTRKYESLEKEHKDLKQENKELHERASQLSADVANLKCTEKVIKRTTSLNFVPAAAEIL